MSGSSLLTVRARTLVVGLVSAVFLSQEAPAAPTCSALDVAAPFTFPDISATLDLYGGDVRMPCTGGQKSMFYTEKGNNRWYFCTPAGNRFFQIGVYNASPSTAAQAKVGGSAPLASSLINRRLMTWGFNTLGSYSSTYGIPTGVSNDWPGTKNQPVKMAYTGYARPSYYSLCDGQATGCAGIRVNGTAVKEIMSTVDPTVYTGWGGWKTPDFLDEKYKKWVVGYVRTNSVGRSFLTNSNTVYMVGWEIDDSDYLIGFGAGSQFSTIHGGEEDDFKRNQPHLAWITLITQPFQAGQYHIKAKEWGLITYPDTEVKNKKALADFFATKYGSIGALNRAWGSTYSSFGSDSVAHAGEAVGAGDGSQTAFTHAFGHGPVDPRSILVRVNGVPVATDDGRGCLGGDATGFRQTKNADGTYNDWAVSGTCLNPVDYTWSMTINFKTPPVGPVTVDYRSGGWGVGTGLLDEAGSHPWIPHGVKASYLWLEPGGPDQRVTQAFKDDMDAFLREQATRYFAGMRSAIDEFDPGRLYFGPSFLGSWGTPTRKEILQAAAGYVDVLPLYNLPTGHPSDPQRIEFIRQYFGDKPWTSWEASAAQPDSAMANRILPDLPRVTSATQAERGQRYGDTINLLLNTRTADGTYPIAGLKWWEYRDSNADGGNWGLVSIADNAYDGTGAQVAPGVDAWGCRTGGEVANYGDVITKVTQAHKSVYNQILAMAAQSESSVIAFTSDYHGVCSPLGTNGKGPRTAQCDKQRKIADMIHAWKPDFILSGGEDVYTRGHRSDVYKAVHVKTAAPVNIGVQEVTVDGTQLNTNLFHFGTQAMPDGPYLLQPNTYLGVEEGTDRWEMVRVISVRDPQHFTAAFTKAHPAGALVRGSGQTPFMNDIARRKFWPVMGNHDYGGGDRDFCYSTVLPCGTKDYAASMEFWTQAYQNGKTYYTKQYGSLLTVFHIDGNGLVESTKSTSPQGQKFLADMRACTTPWCISVTHQPVYTSNVANGTYKALRDWVGGPNVDLVLSGHDHWYERHFAPNYNGSKQIPYITAGTGGEVPAKLLPPVPTVQATFSELGAVKLVLGPTTMTVEFYNIDGVLKDRIELTKPQALKSATSRATASLP